MADIFDIDFLRQTLGDEKAVYEIERTQRGHVRIETAFIYPDRTSVELYLAREPDVAFAGASTRLTDFGNTIGWLMDTGISPNLGDRREKVLRSILDATDVRRSGAALETNVTLNDLALGIIRLGQACIRVADLTYLEQRTRRRPPQFAAVLEPREPEVELQLRHILTQYDIPFRPDTDVPLRSGKVVRVDFEVRARRRPVAVMTLPGDLRRGKPAKQRAEHVFATLYDLMREDWHGDRLATLDDRSKIYSPEDISRIQDIAEVIPLSESRRLTDFLLAA